MSKRVIIMSAIPGAGKSTYIRNNFPDAFIVSADYFFMHDGVYEFDHTKLGSAHGQCFRNFMEAIQAGIELVVVDNTNTTMKEINTYAKPAKELGYDIEVVVLQYPIDKAYERNVHGVPFEAIQRMSDRIENTSRLVKTAWPTIVVNNEK